jgi:hypothetical protein
MMESGWMEGGGKEWKNDNRGLGLWIKFSLDCVSLNSTNSLNME